MTNIKVLEEIVKLLERYANDVQDKYVKCAFQAKLIKYKMELDNEYSKNALAVVEHKIEHLVRKLK